jgi:hypothetical protein
VNWLWNDGFLLTIYVIVIVLLVLACRRDGPKMLPPGAKPLDHPPANDLTVVSCGHDWTYLRREGGVDVFYCKRCLKQRRVSGRSGKEA